MKLAILDGMPELEKFEDQADKVKFKLFIPRCAMQIGKSPRLWSTKNGPNYVVIGTPDVIAISKLPAGAHVPDNAVTCTYLKL